MVIIFGGIDEPAETFRVELSSPTNADVSSDAGAGTGTGTINDDDNAPTSISLSASPASVGEEDGATEITVTATVDGDTTFAEDTDVTVSVGKAADAAVSGTDYTAVDPFTVTIAAGESSGSAKFTLTPTDDDLDEDDESLSLTGSSGSLTVSDGTVALEDDDAKPTLSIGDAAAVTEGGTASFTISLSAESGRDVTVKWATAADSDGANPATSGEDYTAVSATTVTIAAGATEATVSVTTLQDAIDEPAETFRVELSSPTNADVSSDAGAGTGTGTINDDDNAPTSISLSASPASVGEEDGATEITVTATVDGDTTFAEDTDVTVSVGKAADAAVSGTDYTAVDPFTVTIAAGESSGSAKFTLTPTDDDLDEDDESLSLTGSSGSLTVSDGTVALEDDDAKPTLSIGDAAAVTEGGTASFTISLSAESGRDVTVKWATAADSDGANPATSGEDYTAVSATTVTIAAGATEATVSVTTLQDAIDEPAETFRVELSSPTNADVSSDAGAGTGTGTINDDDNAPTSISLSASPASVGEEDGATEITVTATVDGDTTFAEDTDVTVSVGKAADAAVSGTDYTAVDPFTVTIAAGESSGSAKFTLTPTDDDLDEDDESLSLTGSSGSLTVSDGTVALEDDDAKPTLSIGDAAAVTEGGTASFTISLSAESGRDVTVKWATAADSDGANPATSGEDYTAVSATTVTIAAGATEATVSVTTLQDAIDEPAETFRVELSSPTNADVSSDAGAGTGTGTINDDDNAPTSISLSASPASVGEEDGATEITVTATVDGDTTFAEDTDVTVSVGKAADAAVSGTDYTAVDPFTVTIAAGESSGSAKFTLTPTDDDLDEDGESLSLSGARRRRADRVGDGDRADASRTTTRGA